MKILHFFGSAMRRVAFECEGGTFNWAFPLYRLISTTAAYFSIFHLSRTDQHQHHGERLSQRGYFTLAYSLISSPHIHPHTQSGFDQNRIYSVPVLAGERQDSINGGNGLNESAADLERSFWEFLYGFRVGGEFVYR